MNTRTKIKATAKYKLETDGTLFYLTFAKLGFHDGDQMQAAGWRVDTSKNYPSLYTSDRALVDQALEVLDR